jgi:hypothetical protein
MTHHMPTPCAHARPRLQAAAVADARERPQQYVMKPQREGGGNNIYGAAVAAALRGYRASDAVTALAEEAGASASVAVPAEDLSAYILMQRIFPRNSTSIFVRGGNHSAATAVSELGVYGVYLGDGATVHLNAAAGHLLRTKVEGTDEGGVAAGFAVLDSPLLTQD